MDHFTFKTYSKGQVRAFARALFALLGSPVLITQKLVHIRLLVLYGFLLLASATSALAGGAPGTLTRTRSYTEVAGPGTGKQNGIGKSTALSTNARAALAGPDSDGDGVDDDVDLDDDNDGILDTVEMACNRITNGDFATTANWNFPPVVNAIQLGVHQLWSDTDGSINAANKILSVNTVPFNLISGQTYYFSFAGMNASVNTTRAVDFAFVLIDGSNNIVQTIETYKTRASGTGNILVSNTAMANFAKQFNATATGSYRLAVTWDVNELQAAPADDINLDNVALNYCDTDNDGIPDSLDLDSDGDGCADAIEGGANFTIPGGQVNGTTGRLTGSVSSATATNGVPTIAGNGQTIGISQLSAVNACTDTDGDGVTDLDDLDDDNDGILDTAECAALAPYRVYTYNRIDPTLATNVPFTVTGQTSQTTVVNQTVAGTDLNFGGVNWKQIASNVIPDATGKIDVVMKPSVSTNGAFAFADAILISNGIGTNFIIDNNTTGYSQVGTWLAQTLAGNFNTTLSFVVPANYPTASATWSFTNLPLNCDTDGDGIANSLDLDSDGDGCADAVEGGAAFITSSLVSSTMAGGSTNVKLNLPTPVSTATATMGVPIIAGTGQSILHSQNAAVNACTDTDGDGVTDTDDLDDDNDGILDTVEGLNCVPTVLTGEFNGTFGTISAATRFRNLQNPIPGPYTYTVPNNSDAGQYAVTSNAYGQWFLAPIPTLRGHTTGLDDDAYLMVNGATTVGTFYQETIAVGQNTNYTASVWARNWTGAGAAAGDPTIALRVFDATGTTLLGQALVSGFTIAQNWVNGAATINTGLNTQVVVRLQNVSVQSGGNDFAIDDFSFGRADGSSLTCNSIDTDNDGIPNHLDLDSDADGCADAIEGGAAFNTSNLVSSTMAGGSTNVTQNLPAPVGSTTATMGVPVIAGTGQAIGISTTSAVNGCTDTDNDGIVDIDDLDDDNDGILDTVECVPTNLVINGDFASGLTGWTNTNGTWIASGGGAANITNNAPAHSLKRSVTGLNSTNTNGEIKLSLFVAANNIANTDAYLNILLGNTTYGQFRIVGGVLSFIGFNGASADVTPVTVPLAGTNFFPNATITIPWIGQPNTADLDFQFIANQSDFSIDNVNIQNNPLCDTDNDGTPNSLDLDSDGDGCSDAIEGGAAFTPANITPAGALTGTVSAATATFGVPTQAGTGQAIGTSQNAAVQDPNCIPPCSATVAPALSATSKTNTCPATTIDLSTITVSNTPVSSTLSWHTGTPATAANRITAITSVTAGTYYAAFYDATANCFSGSLVTPVTAVTTACCSATVAPALSATTKANICPVTTVDLSTITATNASATVTLTWHSGTPATAANRITNVTSVTAGIYYAAFYDAAANCYSNLAVTTVQATTVACCSVGSVAPALSTQTKTNVCPATTIDLSTITVSNTPAGTSLTWHFASSATAANRITNITSVTAGIYYAGFYDPAANCYSNFATTAVFTTTVACCQSGTVAPALSVTSKTNVCPATTIDLSTITASNTPVGAVLSWHRESPATASNRITAITAVAPGTYYAAFFDATNNCFSGTGTAVTPVTASTVACCPNPSVGGSLTLVGTLPLCSVSNQGIFTLTGQTGTVVKWQTSTNGGITFTDIPGTAGLTQYSFTNAQNNQQFRAVVNAGGSCADANSTPFATPTSASACSVDCDVKPGDIKK